MMGSHDADSYPTSLASVGALALNEALFALRRAGYRIVKLSQRYPDDTADPMSYTITEELT